MENEHTALSSTNTTTTAKEKRGSTPLVVLFTFTITLLFGLAFYARPPFHSSYGVGGIGGTTRGAITTASLYGPVQNPCIYPNECECPSCNWQRYHVCTPPSETVHCPVTASSYCPSTAVIFSGPYVDCTQIIIGVNNYGYACNDIVAHMKMNFVYYNCMDNPSSANGACANKNICEYPNGNHP